MTTTRETWSLQVVLAPGEDGFLVATCPTIPGCISQGRNREEALANIKEAIQLCLDNQAEEGWQLPPGDVELVRLEIPAVA